MRIIRAIQKKMISYPVSKTEVGWYISRSFVFSGQPMVENVQSPEENHVSSVSGSWMNSPSQNSHNGLSPETTIATHLATSFSYPGLGTHLSSLCHTGIRCPYQICREMHQSRRLSIQ